MPRFMKMKTAIPLAPRFNFEKAGKKKRRKMETVCGAAVVAGALVYRRAIQRRARYGALTLAAAAPMCAQPVLLLVSDLDGTLAGCASQSTESTANRDESLAALAEFNAAWCARTERTTVLGRCDVVLCYSTGRELHSYVDLVKRLTAYGRTTTEQRPLMQPNVLITHDGTRIDWFDDASSSSPPRQDVAWKARMAAAWDGPHIRAVFAAAVAKRGVQDAVEGVERLKLSEGVSGDPFRYSVLVNDAVLARTLCADIEAVLEAEESERYGVFWCSGGPNKTFWLAALPRSGGKGNALEWVRHQLGVERAATFVAGDAGNDIPMFSVDGVRGVAVANAHDELRALVEGASGHHYSATRKYAGGVVEALQGWGQL